MNVIIITTCFSCIYTLDYFVSCISKYSKIEFMKKIPILLTIVFLSAIQLAAQKQSKESINKDAEKTLNKEEQKLLPI